MPEEINTNDQLKIIKPVRGIENSKFRPIIRTLPKTKIKLSPIRIRPAQKNVQKMLKEIKPPITATTGINQGGQNSQFAMTPTDNFNEM